MRLLSIIILAVSMTLSPVKSRAQTTTPSRSCNPAKQQACGQALRDADFALKKQFEAIQLLVKQNESLKTESEELTGALIRMTKEADKASENQTYLIGGGLLVGVIVGLVVK